MHVAALMTRNDTIHARGAAAWDISDEVLAVLEQEARPGARTLETGAGRSTIMLAAAGAEHHCVTPSHDEVARIRAHCAASGISLERTRFHVGFSQDLLPNLRLDPLDLVLIDGGHGFPIPAVDFQYAAPRLKVGGVLIIDDVDLWTGAMLVDFLKREPAWRLEGVMRGRTAVFRLVDTFAAHEWTRQPAVVAKSRWSQTWRKAKNAAALLARMDFAALGAKLRNEKALAEAARRDY